MQKVTLTLALLASLSCGAQIQPPSFPSTVAPNNRYSDYVGFGLSVDAPLSIGGYKVYTIANEGDGGTGDWGAAITAPILNKQIIKAGPDTLGCSQPVTPGSLTGNFGLIFRGGNNCEFGAKALACQTAGAIAVIIVNNIPGGPVGMGAGAVGASVTIPVFMISQADGQAIVNEINNGQTVTASITGWGNNKTNDLGILSNGYTQWHSMVAPLSQVVSSNGNPAALMNQDGAFIANFGTADETNVKLKSSLSFTPQGGSAQQVHTDSVTFASFPHADSIYAVGIGNAYNAHPTGVGTFNMTYTLSMANTDEYLPNNSISHSYTISNDIYSKGRYDFINNGPIANVYVRPGGTAAPFVSGNLYYFPVGNHQAISTQYKISSNAGTLNGETTLALLYKWKDTVVVDSMMELGELSLVAVGSKTYVLTDSSGDNFEIKYADLNGDTNAVITLEANTWYFAAIELSDQCFMGYDGITNFFPRTYLRHHGSTEFTEFYTSNVPLSANDIESEALNDPTTLISQFAFDGSDVTTRLTVDSARYAQQKKGYVGALAIKISPTPSSVKTSNGVKAANLDLYPNPANNELNINVVTQQSTKFLHYTVIDMTGKNFYSTTHKNVVGKNDSININTEGLPSGNYVVIVTNDQGISTTKKFVVAH